MDTMTAELPVLLAEMSAADLVMHTTAIEKIIGPKAEVSCRAARDKYTPGRNVTIAAYPDGICGRSSSEHFYGADWFEAFRAAYAWAYTRPVIQREAVVRKMALAIIDITDQRGDCSERLLIARDFTSAEVRELHEDACARAGEMAGNRPFSVVGLS